MTETKEKRRNRFRSRKRERKRTKKIRSVCITKRVSCASIFFFSLLKIEVLYLCVVLFMRNTASKVENEIKYKSESTTTTSTHRERQTTTKNVEFFSPLKFNSRSTATENLVLYFSSLLHFVLCRSISSTNVKVFSLKIFRVFRLVNSVQFADLYISRANKKNKTEKRAGTYTHILSSIFVFDSN